MDSNERRVSYPDAPPVTTALSALLDEARLAVAKQESVDSAWIDAAAGLVARLIANAEHEQLAAARTALRDLTNAAYRSRKGAAESNATPVESMITQLRVLNSVTLAGEQLLGPRAAGAQLETGSVAARLLVELLAADSEVPARTLMTALDVHDTQLSREGRKLLDRGLVFKHKYGREVAWSLTSTGREAARMCTAAMAVPSLPADPITVNTVDEFRKAVDAAAECIAFGAATRAARMTYYCRADIKTPEETLSNTKHMPLFPLIATGPATHLYLRSDLATQPWARQILEDSETAGARHDAS